MTKRRKYDIIVVTMYIVKNIKRVKDKIYTSTLLVEGYRENGKVRHRTKANLTSWPGELVEEFRLLLKGGKVTGLKNLRHSQGKSCGGIIVIHEICKRLGILKALGKSRQSRLSLLLIVGRILTRGSRLHLVSWSKDEAIEEVLGIKHFDEDDLYDTLDWLSKNQERIENSLFRHRNRKEVRDIFLYDVTSSYLEGDKNELAGYGYNRDKKKGKKQIVIGLLTDKEGYPVSVEVFKGNTQDPKTVLNQLKKLRNRFGVKRVIFVGDRGMIKTPQIQDINEFKWNFITAITKSQIKTLIEKGVIQMDLFDEELAEARDEDYRYILRRNPTRAREMALSRISKLRDIIRKIKERNTYLLEHKRARGEVALRDMREEIEKKKLVGIIEVNLEDNWLKFLVKKGPLKEISRLDGCYVIKTDVPDLDKEIIHSRYKDLTKVEHAFRTIKTTLEEVRPIYVRKEKRTRGHVFVCMLAYMVVKYMWDNLKDSGFTEAFIFDTLDKIEYAVYKIRDETLNILPDELLSHQRLIIDNLGLKLPYQL